MEQIPQLNTWKGLISLVILLLALYWLLKLVLFILKQFAKRNITNKRTIIALQRGLLIFKPVALVLVLLDFISINYITHTILLVIIGVFGYSHIRNYVSGIFLKINPLINKGASAQIGDFTGEIKTMLPFGMILSTEDGERFVNYSTLEHQGFAIKSNDTSLLRQTLFLHTELSQDQILDTLFDNPLLNYQDHPEVKATETDALKLQYTLETGATTKTLISFLEAQNIKTSLTNNTLS